MTHRLPLTTLLAVLACVASGCVPPPTPLIGTWETNIHHPDGMRTQIVTIYQADGTLTREVIRGPQANRQQVDQRVFEEGTWDLFEGVLEVSLSDGTTWKDEVQNLDYNMLTVKSIEGADPHRPHEFVGSHRR